MSNTSVLKEFKLTHGKNFLAHCAQGTYDGTKIVRSIKSFIVQFGDPTNTGKGGESIWGGYFEDEFNESLRHSQRVS